MNMDSKKNTGGNSVMDEYKIGNDGIHERVRDMYLSDSEFIHRAEKDAVSATKDKIFSYLLVFILGVATSGASIFVRDHFKIGVLADTVSEMKSEIAIISDYILNNRCVSANK